MLKVYRLRRIVARLALSRAKQRVAFPFVLQGWHPGGMSALSGFRDAFRAFGFRDAFKLLNSFRKRPTPSAPLGPASRPPPSLWERVPILLIASRRASGRRPPKEAAPAAEAAKGHPDRHAAARMMSIPGTVTRYRNLDSLVGF